MNDDDDDDCRQNGCRKVESNANDVWIVMGFYFLCLILVMREVEKEGVDRWQQKWNVKRWKKIEFNSLLSYTCVYIVY